MTKRISLITLTTILEVIEQTDSDSDGDNGEDGEGTTDHICKTAAEPATHMCEMVQAEVPLATDFDVVDIACATGEDLPPRPESPRGTGAVSGLALSPSPTAREVRFLNSFPLR